MGALVCSASGMYYYTKFPGGEENILYYSSDSYSNEDIFLHEFSHGIHLLGAKYAVSGLDSSLQYWYGVRRSQGLWSNTYSMSTYKEYWAEGVQSWFNVNDYSNPPNGIHGPISTKKALKSYDYELYKLIAKVFPCGNNYIKRCETTRSKELAQKLLMNCNEGDGEREEGGETDPEECGDLNDNCAAWLEAGYCSGTHEHYMSQNCRNSCGTCPEDETCNDDNTYCQAWAVAGYCTHLTYQDWMGENCKKSCNSCPRENEEKEGEEEEGEEEEEDLPPVHCYDRDPQKCKKRAQKGHCSNPTKANYMKKNCEKSCKKC